jgi:hypothetical protein
VSAELCCSSVKAAFASVTRPKIAHHRSRARSMSDKSWMKGLNGVFSTWRSSGITSTLAA